MTASTTYGRGTWLPLTNKSGGAVAAGDVVIIDTTNNDAFTTTTSANFTGGVGIAQGAIANNGVGLVAFTGYVALVNVQASVTRGDFGATYTVAKQATDAGAARTTGTFCQFLTGGTTPDALLFPVDLGGTALTNPMTGVGDMIRGGTSGLPTRLAPSAAGKILTDGGAATTPAWGQGPLTTTGDLMIGATGGTPTRLAGVAVGSLLISGGVGAAPSWDARFHGVKAYMSTTQNVNNTTAALTFDTEEFDSDAYHDTVTNNTRITVPSAALAGKYLLMAGTFASANTASWIGIRLNGTTNIRGYQSIILNGYRSLVAIQNLANGDYVEAMVSDTASVNFGHASALDAQSWFAAVFLG